eukprot:CAMPEP_0172530624 /NCGR_PEP_ID=MMETSP1067-20121228/4303_1 /TAXON_ID=265564 ORGANISM="Thalassiosira punctigera, Strain Tpunct2005C2" /NCGR_SAMPLE_ID=MMETSP1067 /ASSEMBLY_ACC=CAM_ASM_000444 /LENGTH=155 /DNA_ID=CAMNT_0013314869 /DNA_START=102 /DNA_END=569 /DNA_ORIENTATION=+
MRIVPIPVLFASVMCTFGDEVAEMGDPYTSSEADLEEPYKYVSILKAVEEERAIMDKQWRKENRKEISVKGCDPKIEALATCFEFVKEPNGEACWGDCVETNMIIESCEDFCWEVEQCRSDTCKSGNACLTQYYDTMNCALSTCNCDTPKTHLRA